MRSKHTLFYVHAGRAITITIFFLLPKKLVENNFHSYEGLPKLRVDDPDCWSWHFLILAGSLMNFIDHIGEQKKVGEIGRKKLLAHFPNYGKYPVKNLRKT